MNSTILLVERGSDAKELREALETTSVNCRVEIIDDARRAVDYCKGAGQFADRGQYPVPDLVLVDVNLEHGNGFEILKTVRTESSFRHSVVLVLSSARHVRDVACAYALGANAFLVKPADSANMPSFARKLTDFWLTENIPPPTL
jgi:DNA-binding response OmpR family regulator